MPTRRGRSVRHCSKSDWPFPNQPDCAISPCMNPISAFAIFFIIWWVTLFAMLSVGLKTQGEAGEVVPGTVESAPARPRFLLVTGLTTLVAVVIFAGFYWFAVTRGLRFDNLADFLPGFMRVPLSVQP